MNSTPKPEPFVMIRREHADGSVSTYTGPATYVGQYAGHVPAKGA